MNHPNDRGGPTNYGITLKTLAAWRGTTVDALTAQDIQELTETEAKRIYEELYINRPNWHQLEDDWTFMYAIDCTVHHGQRRATMLMQDATGGILKTDGVFGPISRRTVNTISRDKKMARQWRKRFQQARAEFFVDICERDPSQLVFLRGWLARTFDWYAPNQFRV